MKLEPVLTMKIVDNFVCFGMPFPGPGFQAPERAKFSMTSLVPRLSWNANMYNVSVMQLTAYTPDSGII